MKILENDIFISEIASWKLPSKNLQANHLLIRNCRMTFLNAKNCRPISSEILRDCFSLFANLSGDVLVKKSVADRQRRAEIHRTAWLSRQNISPKIIVDFPFLFDLRDSIEVDDIADGEVVLAEDHINRNATSECQTQSLQETITSGPEQNTHQEENR